MTSFATTTLDPAWPTWGSLLRADRRDTVHREWEFVVAAKPLLRRQLWELANHNHAAAVQLAQAAGFAPAAWQEQPPIVELASDERPILATGHQPVLFHAGLLFKYQATDRAAQENQGHAIAFCMDTDHGDAGDFLLPVPGRAKPALEHWDLHADHVSLATPPGLFAHARIRPAGELTTLAARVTAALRELACPEAAATAADVLRDYCRLAGQPAALAHPLIRKQYGYHSHLQEVRLSQVCQLPTVTQVLIQLARDAERLNTVYNDTLVSWRKQRGIRTRANPFPDLGREPAGWELPCWVIDTQSGTRQPLWVRSLSGRYELFAGDRPLGRLDAHAQSWPAACEASWIAPRGALISLLFRWLGCDLFVHGLGGQIYDRYTDQFALEYLGAVLPPFAVASATRYLFPQQVARLSEVDQSEELERQWTHQPESLLALPTISPTIKEQVRAALAEKQTLIDSLQRHKQAGTSAAAEGRRLQELQQLLRALVRQLLPTIPWGAEPDQVRAAVTARTYPWFFWREEPRSLPAGAAEHDLLADTVD